MYQQATKNQAFDVIALEEKSSDHQTTDSFQDGFWDASVLQAEPNPDAWLSSSDYRKGYMEGIATYYDKKYIGF